MLLCLGKHVTFPSIAVSNNSHKYGSQVQSCFIVGLMLPPLIIDTPGIVLVA